MVRCLRPSKLEAMVTSRLTPNEERLSELVAVPSDTPLTRSRTVVSERGLTPREDDHLFRVADALVRLGCGVPAPARNASMPID